MIGATLVLAILSVVGFTLITMGARERHARRARWALMVAIPVMMGYAFVAAHTMAALR